METPNDQERVTVNFTKTEMVKILDTFKILTETIKPDTFHNRQVEALRRQSAAIDYIKEQRQFIAEGTLSTHNAFTEIEVLKILDTIVGLLISA